MEAEEDALCSYTLPVDAYVTKPVDFQRFIHVARHIDDFFVTTRAATHAVNAAHAATPTRG